MENRIAVVTDINSVVIGSGGAAIKALEQKKLYPYMLIYIVSGVDVEDCEHPKLKQGKDNPLGHFEVDLTERIPKVKFHEHDGYTIDPDGNVYINGIIQE